MSQASQARLMAMEEKLNSTRETAQLLGVSHNRAWLARRGAANLTREQLDRLEAYLYGKLANLEVLALRGSGRTGAA